MGSPVSCRSQNTTRRSDSHEGPHYSLLRCGRLRSNDLGRRGCLGGGSRRVGQTYRDAKSTIQGQGASVVIATRTGGSADVDKCIVTNAWDKPSVTQSRKAPGPDEVWVALSCNAAIAGPGSPGNSAASQEGRQALIAKEAN
jgi:hypothetical protein